MMKLSCKVLLLLLSLDVFTGSTQHVGGREVVRAVTEVDFPSVSQDVSYICFLGIMNHCKGKVTSQASALNSI